MTAVPILYFSEARSVRRGGHRATALADRGIFGRALEVFLRVERSRADADVARLRLSAEGTAASPAWKYNNTISHTEREQKAGSKS